MTQVSNAFCSNFEFHTLHLPGPNTMNGSSFGLGILYSRKEGNKSFFHSIINMTSSKKSSYDENRVKKKQQ